MKNDPDENHNIIEKQTELAQELENKIEQWRNSFTAAKIMEKEADFDDAMRQRLEALGYLG